MSWPVFAVSAIGVLVGNPLFGKRNAQPYTWLGMVARRKRGVMRWALFAENQSIATRPVMGCNSEHPKFEIPLVNGSLAWPGTYIGG